MGKIDFSKPLEDNSLENEVQRQYKILKYRTNEITPEDEFVSLLRKSLVEKKPLRVKCGIDPTSTDVHLGHTVPYRKMRQFQDLGHIGVVIIGDYTASIGDPTGKNESRPSLDEATVKKNAQTYMEQVYTVLDREKTEIRFQTEWFEKVTLKDILKWAGQTTVAKLLSHDTFKDRLDKGFSLGLHELFYPMLQGVDSVFVEADIELGGSDQRFNVLMGRDYQRAIEMNTQVAILNPIITGTCGSQKMSKSLGNYIGILDEPFDKFGKIMSIPDELMVEYFTYVTDLPEEEVQNIEEGLKTGSLHPNDTKKKLARLVVGFFHGEKTADEMQEKFESVFKKGGVPDDAPKFKITDQIKLIDLLVESKLLGSKGEVRRMVKQNAVSLVDGEKLTDENLLIDKSYAGKSIKVGKRKFLVLES